MQQVALLIQQLMQLVAIPEPLANPLLSFCVYLKTIAE